MGKCPTACEKEMIAGLLLSSLQPNNFNCMHVQSIKGPDVEASNSKPWTPLPPLATVLSQRWVPLADPFDRSAEESRYNQG